MRVCVFACVCMSMLFKFVSPSPAKIRNNGIIDCMQYASLSNTLLNTMASNTSATDKGSDIGIRT